MEGLVYSELYFLFFNTKLVLLFVILIGAANTGLQRIAAVCVGKFKFILFTLILLDTLDNILSESIELGRYYSYLLIKILLFNRRFDTGSY